MAPAGCSLDDEQLAEQTARYRRLSAQVVGVERDGLTARVLFDERLDAKLLERTLAIERGCCSFFTLDYDSSARILLISSDPEHTDGLHALIATLTECAERRSGALRCSYLYAGA
jgi:hypothetical protein